MKIIFSSLAIAFLPYAASAETKTFALGKTNVHGLADTVEIKLQVGDIKEIPAMKKAILSNAIYVFSEDVGYGKALLPYYPRKGSTESYMKIGAQNRVCKDAGYGHALGGDKPRFVDDSTGYRDDKKVYLDPYVMGVNGEVLAVYKNDVQVIPYKRPGGPLYSDLHLNDWSPGYINMTISYPTVKYVLLTTWNEIHCLML